MSEVNEGATDGVPHLPTDGGEWVNEIRKNLDRWAGEVRSADDSDMQESPLASTPDLYSLYGELCALRQEMRRGLKRQQEASARFSEFLERFEPRAENDDTGGGGNRNDAPNAKTVALPLAEIAVRLDRFSEALRSTPPKKFFGGHAAWSEYAGSLDEAFGIVRDHLVSTLSVIGISRIATVGERFDPLAMVAVAVDESGVSPDDTVTEDITPGFYIGKRVLKPAEVKVARSRNEKGQT